jgi:hypothetical protein
MTTRRDLTNEKILSTKWYALSKIINVLEIIHQWKTYRIQRHVFQEIKTYLLNYVESWSGEELSTPDREQRNQNFLCWPLKKLFVFFDQIQGTLGGGGGGDSGGSGGGTIRTAVRAMGGNGVEGQSTVNNMTSPQDRWIKCFTGKWQPFDDLSINDEIREWDRNWGWIRIWKDFCNDPLFRERILMSMSMSISILMLISLSISKWWSESFESWHYSLHSVMFKYNQTKENIREILRIQIIWKNFLQRN